MRLRRVLTGGPVVLEHVAGVLQPYLHGGPVHAHTPLRHQDLHTGQRHQGMRQL